MRVIPKQYHTNGLNKKLTTFNVKAWRASYESRRQEEPSTFCNYAQRKSIGIVDETKKQKKALREFYKGNREKRPSTFFNYGERHAIGIEDVTTKRRKKK